MVVVQEVERERQHPAGALVFQVERSRPAEGREQRVRRERARREIDELLGQLERLGPHVAVETHDEIGLDVGDVAEDHVDVLGDLLDLVHPRAAGLGLVAQVVPRLDPRQNRLEVVRPEPLEVRLREQRQAALRDVPHAAPRHRLLHRLHVIVEAHAEVRVVPPDDRVLHLGEQERQVGPELRKAERLVVHRRVDAEAAGVGTPEAADHRHDLDGGRLRQRGGDELPALLQRRQVGRLARGHQVDAQRPVRAGVPQHVGHHLAVGEAEHVVEVLSGVLGVAARVRPAQHGDRPPAPEQALSA